MSLPDASSATRILVRTTPSGDLHVDAGIAGRWNIVGVGDSTWKIDFPASAERWLLCRGSDREGGFVLVDADDRSRELGRATPLAGPDTSLGEATVLTGDGRAFRIEVIARRSARVRVTGWEGPGAYFEAEPNDERGWIVRPTLAGRELGIDPTLIVLLAAELAVAGPEDRE